MRSSSRTSAASAASATNTKIYIQEHLTKHNKSLLSAAKTQLAATHKYPGYVKNGTKERKSTKDREKKERREGNEEEYAKWEYFLSNGENKNDLMNRFENFL